MTLQQQQAAASTAIARAARLEPQLHAFVELSPAGGLPKAGLGGAGLLAFLPYAAKDLFLRQTTRPAADLLRRSNLIVLLTPMYCAVSMSVGPRASGSRR